jgi:hypothetical protein
MYQAFMSGYVRRINESTLKVPITGVRIGHAKYTRLAQINLQTGIITFSRYAIENVPERCRRYLVIHELSHVKEARHNRRFWNIVGKYVPDCRKVEMELQEAFQLNIRNKYVLDLPAERDVLRRLENPNLLLVRGNSTGIQRDIENEMSAIMDSSADDSEGCFGWSEDEFGAWTDADEGIVCGGADVDPANI